MDFRRSSLAPLCALAALLAAPAALAAPPLKPAPSKPTTAKPGALDPELQAALKTAPTQSQFPNSDYVRLLDIGNVTIQSDGTIVAEYRTTYKLFNERARQLAEVSLPYNSSYQSLKVIRARTIKKDGSILDVKPADMRTASPYSDYLMYDDAMTVGFSMPGIEDDCIVDYTWRETTRPLLMPGQFATYWGFSGIEPVGTCRFTLTTPADKEIKAKIYNDDALKPTVVASADHHSKTYTWELDNIKPLDIEPAMPNVADVRVWMEVSSLGSWQDIATWFWGLQKPQAAPNDAIRATVAKLTADKKTDDDKARAIYDWVANRTRYVGLEFGLSAFRPHPASEVHDKLYGDCKDKATLLISMLGLAGIKAHPVLLHAEERRPVASDLPTLTAFNHCIAIAEVSGKDVWLDATAETCAYGDIPAGDRGVQAFVVRDGQGRFQTIPTYQAPENGLAETTKLTILPDGGANLQTEMNLRGAASQGMRAAVRSLNPAKRKEMAQRIAQSFSPGATLTNYTLPPAEEKDGPFVMSLSLQAPNYAHKSGSLLMIPLASGSDSGSRRNPYLKEQRVWPIVEEDTSLTEYVATIALPDGYEVLDTPADVNLTSPLAEYHRTLTKSPDGRTLTLRYATQEHPGTVPAADYAKIRAYYDAYIKTADDQIVLKKTAK